MGKKRFEIQYRDPETEETITVEKEFDDNPPEFPAKLWAEDYAYTRADKGWYRVRELPSPMS